MKVLYCLTLLGSLVLLGLIACRVHGDVGMDYLEAYHPAALALLAGQSPWALPASAVYVDPPFGALFWSSLSWLPAMTAAWTASVLCTICVVLACGLAGLRHPLGWLLILTGPVVDGLCGNSSEILLPVVTLLVLDAGHQRDRWTTGALLAVAGLIKPLFAVLMIWLLWTHRRKAWRAFMYVGVAGVSFWVWGWGLAPWWTAVQAGAAITSIVHGNMVLPLGLRTIALGMLGILVLKSGRLDDRAKLVQVILAALLLSPTVWPLYLPLFYPVVVNSTRKWDFRGQALVWLPLVAVLVTPAWVSWLAALWLVGVTMWATFSRSVPPSHLARSCHTGG